MFTTLRFLHGSNGRRGPADMAHDFVVKPWPRSSLFAAKPYEYHCIRCGWSFLFNRPRGQITALDQSGAPLSEPSNTARSRTFAAGPCPAFYTPAQVAPAAPKRWRHRPPSAKEGLRRSRFLFWFHVMRQTLLLRGSEITELLVTHG